MPLRAVRPNALPQSGLPWVDALASAVQHDPFGGLSPMPMGGVVVNPEHAAFRLLEAHFPKVASALRRSRMSFHYLDEEPMAGMSGGTRSFRAQPGGPIGSLGFMHRKTPNLEEDLKTAIHEALHGLYGAKSGYHFPPPKAVFPIAERYVSKYHADPQFLANLRRSLPEGAIEALAQNVYHARYPR